MVRYCIVSLKGRITLNGSWYTYFSSLRILLSVTGEDFSDALYAQCTVSEEVYILLGPF